jgi:hypothetical protein
VCIEEKTDVPTWRHRGEKDEGEEEAVTSYYPRDYLRNPCLKTDEKQVKLEIG